MNLNVSQFLSLLRSILKVAAGAAITHGLIGQSNAEFWSGIIVVAGALLWSHLTHSDPAEAVKEAQSSLPGLSLFLLLLVPVVMCGCGTVYNSSKITKHTDSFFGVRVLTSSTSTQTPEIDLGFARSVTEIIPTSTNSLVNAPKSMTAFKLEQAINPFATGIEENSGTGDVYVGGTNDTSKAIIPSAYMPPQAPSASPVVKQ